MRKERAQAQIGHEGMHGKLGLADRTARIAQERTVAIGLFSLTAVSSYACAHARAGKVFVLSPLSITFLDILQIFTDCEQDNRSDRCVIDGLTSLTSITDSSLAKS